MKRFVKVTDINGNQYILDCLKFSMSIREHIKELVEDENLGSDGKLGLFTTMDKDFVKENSLSTDETVDLLNTYHNEIQKSKITEENLYTYFQQLFEEKRGITQDQFKKIWEAIK